MDCKDCPNPSCFWCYHLIVDGMDSWCEIRPAGKICLDYVFNEERYLTLQKYK